MDVLEEKIKKCNNVSALNELRMEVIKSRNGLILLMWQERYWAYKKCPKCANRLYHEGEVED